MRVSSLSCLLLLTVLGCEKAEPKEETKRPEKDAEANRAAAFDPNLAEAVAAASASAAPRAKGGAPEQVEGGPPADGVFAAGAADKEAAKGSLPKITLGSDGSAPRLLLGPSKIAKKLSGTIQIAMQADPRQGAIPVLFDLTIEPKKTEGGDADKPASQPVSVRITAAKIDAPGVPKDVNDQIAKLKGSKIEYSIVPGGAGAGFRFDVPKGAPDDFRDVVRSLSDTLGLLTIPYPDKPLGAGAYFMVTSRDELMGLDLVSYRLVKVKQVTAEGATLEVNTKRYAASRTFDLAGLPPDVDKTLAEFQSSSEGNVELPIGALLPTKGTINSVLAAGLGAGDPKQRPMLQLQSRAQLELK
jgi:hypothetical protein